MVIIELVIIELHTYSVRLILSHAALLLQYKHTNRAALGVRQPCRYVAVGGDVDGGDDDYRDDWRCHGLRQGVDGEGRHVPVPRLLRVVRDRGLAMLLPP